MGVPPWLWKPSYDPDNGWGATAWQRLRNRQGLHRLHSRRAAGEDSFDHWIAMREPVTVSTGEDGWCNWLEVQLHEIYHFLKPFKFLQRLSCKGIDRCNQGLNHVKKTLDSSYRWLPQPPISTTPCQLQRVEPSGLRNSRGWLFPPCCHAHERTSLQPFLGSSPVPGLPRNDDSIMALDRKDEALIAEILHGCHMITTDDVFVAIVELVKTSLIACIHHFARWLFKEYEYHSSIKSQARRNSDIPATSVTDPGWLQRDSTCSSFLNQPMTWYSGIVPLAVPVAFQSLPSLRLGCKAKGYIWDIGIKSRILCH